VNVSPISTTPTYLPPAAKTPAAEAVTPPAEIASSASGAAFAAVAAQYLTKPVRDAVFEQTGQRIAPDATPIPPIALQIAADRRAGIGVAHAYAQAVADPAEDTSTQKLRTQQSGLDVIA
jgi:hypothetical protein